MSFFKKLFGGGASAQDDGERPVGDPVDYKGYTIQATPFQAEGQFQTCGVISRVLDGEEKRHRFVRADRLSTATDAAAMAVRKARQIIDEQGDRLFGN